MFVVVFERVEFLARRGERRAFFGCDFTAADKHEFLTDKRAIHTVEHRNKASAACVHDARFFEHGKHIGGSLQNFLARVYNTFKEGFEIDFFVFRRGLRFFSHCSDDRKNRAFFGLGNRAVRNFRTFFQTLCERFGREVGFAFESNGKPSENLG